MPRLSASSSVKIPSHLLKVVMPKAPLLRSKRLAEDSIHSFDKPNFQQNTVLNVRLVICKVQAEMGLCKPQTLPEPQTLLKLKPHHVRVHNIVFDNIWTVTVGEVRSDGNYERSIWNPVPLV